MARIIPAERCTCGHGLDDHDEGGWGGCLVEKCKCDAMEPEILGHPDVPKTSITSNGKGLG